VSTQIPTPASDDLLAAMLYKLTGGAAQVPNSLAFRIIGVGETLGYELIDRGVLDQKKIGRASRITVLSILEVLRHGVPPPAPPVPPPEAASASVETPVRRKRGRPRKHAAMAVREREPA
jgi:hypothetical protein